MEQQLEKAALEELITVYCRAWSEPERVLREQLLNRVWADDGTYTDPTAHVVGRKELIEHIGKFGLDHRVGHPTLLEPIPMLVAAD